MGTQLLVGLGLAAYVGILLDRRIHFKLPVFVWLFPLLILILLLVKVLRDTSNK